MGRTIAPGEVLQSRKNACKIPLGGFGYLEGIALLRLF
jgi:hypothetical protein